MYCMPEIQRTAYLKEPASLAKAWRKGRGIENIRKAVSLSDLHDELLQRVFASIGNTPPQTKTRMIEL